MSCMSSEARTSDASSKPQRSAIHPTECCVERSFLRSLPLEVLQGYVAQLKLLQLQLAQSAQVWHFELI